MLDFLRWGWESSKNLTEDLVSVMQYRTPRHKQPAVVSCSFCIRDSVQREIGTQQIRQVLRPSMAASTYAAGDRRIKKLVTLLFRDCMIAVALVKGSRFSKRIFESTRKRTLNTL